IEAAPLTPAAAPEVAPQVSALDSQHAPLLADIDLDLQAAVAAPAVPADTIDGLPPPQATAPHPVVEEPATPQTATPEALPETTQAADEREGPPSRVMPEFDAIEDFPRDAVESGFADVEEIELSVPTPTDMPATMPTAIATP